MSIDLFTYTVPEESPFDRIRRLRPDGTEYWSARELMPLLGYDRWENFDATIDRAYEAALNSEQQVSTLFRDVTKKVTTRGVAAVNAADVELARYACYLVAMNGDPRKPEIAAAQTYFAVQTRRAETTMPDLTTPRGVLGLAELYVKAARALVTAQDKITELEPPAQAWRELASANGDMSVGDAAKALARAGVITGEVRLFAELGILGWIYRGNDGRWRVYQHAMEAGYLSQKLQGPHIERGKPTLSPPQVRVTVKGVERLRELLTPPVKELAA